MLPCANLSGDESQGYFADGLAAELIRHRYKESKTVGVIESDPIHGITKIANPVGTVICIAASGGIAKLTTIRFALLAPFLFMIISFAAFQSGQNLMDLVALFAIGHLKDNTDAFDFGQAESLGGAWIAGQLNV